MLPTSPKAGIPPPSTREGGRSDFITTSRSTKKHDKKHGATYPTAGNNSDAEGPAQTAAAHGLNGTAGAIEEGMGNLNRWSQSTTSSQSSARHLGDGDLRIGHKPTSNDASDGCQNSPPRKSSAWNIYDHSRSVSHPQAPGDSPEPRPSMDSNDLFLRSTTYKSSVRSDIGSTSGPAEPPLEGGAYQAGNPIYNVSNASTKRVPSQRPQGRSLSRSSSRDTDSTAWQDQINGEPLHELRFGQKSRVPEVTPRDKLSKDLGYGSKSAQGSSRGKGDVDYKKQDMGNGTLSPPRNKERREKDKKTMLSRALQKANTAVLLDNAQNFEGAMEAYGDACRLLQQVMHRSSGEDDRRKLEAIRITYTNRIQELQDLNPAFQSTTGKSLPARPMSNESMSTDVQAVLPEATHYDNIEGTVATERETRRRSSNDPSNAQPTKFSGASGSAEFDSRASVSISGYGGERVSQDSLGGAYLPQADGDPEDSEVSLRRVPSLDASLHNKYMPPPLSPRRPVSPTRKFGGAPLEDEFEHDIAPRQNDDRHVSHESISWLDTIDESDGSSCSSSVHSISSREGLRQKYMHINDTEAEFDAALDAAVEAAYDEGFEPFEDRIEMAEGRNISPLALRKQSLLQEELSEVKREEAIAAAKSRHRNTLLAEASHTGTSFDYSGDEADEEERMLDEVTKEYMLDGFDFDLQNKSALPRESGSSSFSAGTWNSSNFSHHTTGGIPLSTLTEIDRPFRTHGPHGSSATISISDHHDSASADIMPVHDQSSATDRPPSSLGNVGGNVRSRRLSGLNSKQLKIETSMNVVDSQKSVVERDAREPADSAHARMLSRSLSKSALPAPAMAQHTPDSFPTMTSTAAKSKVPHHHISPALANSSKVNDATLTASSSAMPLPQGSSSDQPVVPHSPGTHKSNGKPPITVPLRKNKSSLSLKNRNMSISSPDGSDMSLGTPLSTTFSSFARKQSIPQLTSTPTVPTFVIDGIPTGGLHLFESDIHAPHSPGTPNPLAHNAPIPLEPCPESHLLRPFWLMRCLYQTIAHPRGGYLSTKLFVPRDVWRVKGVKIKCVDDKVSNCDLLTAALLKLSGVDTLDADAVLEEIQALEAVLDQVQVNLSKKLGNEVGVNGVSALFREAQMAGGSAGTETGSESLARSAVSQSKSYLSSWRKLRSKNSAVGLNTPAVPKDTPKDSLTMSSLPMTSIPNIRFAKRDLSQVDFSGPNATYMSALARLFDAAQILDQIARQVEDPGLKQSSPTHVGLELSVRHASEFFGFYVCRFVLNDITLMLDKFIKRGSEWVLI